MAPVVGHLDWRAANTRFIAGGLVAVYDLDSLAVADHAVIAGQAAVVWQGDDPIPDPDQIDAFVADYAQACGVAVSRQRARAAAQWLVAYIARCEHALSLDEGPATRALRQAPPLQPAP